MSITFAQIFLAALVFYFVVQSFVCLLEIVHLKRTINEVPAEFVHKVTLSQHQKAAHYDIARTVLNWLEVTVTTALIIGLTEGNVINMISDWLMEQVGDAFAFHWMLPASIGLIFVIVDLPFSWYKEFRLREAYGYCRTAPKHWLRGFFLDIIVGWLAVLPILWTGLFMWRHSDQTWWLIGWGLYSIYLIFHLGLAKRLLYVLQKSRAQAVTEDTLLDALAHLGEKANIRISGAYICRESDNDDLPPAFAYGHTNNVHLYFRHDLVTHMTNEDLVAIAAHALARNKSHMYFQAWTVCSAVGFVVFAFLNWLAPQSWFLDEIGFRVYGPGPYYGSLMTFAIVALPVLLFPFKLPMDMFLRHLIFASDTFALKHTSLNVLTHALIELTPSPIRHSTVTLGIFDLLFSHEPSLRARIKRAQLNAAKWEATLEEKRIRQELSTVRQQRENVQVALATGRAQAKFAQEHQKALDAQQARRDYEEQLVRQAVAPTHLQAQALARYQDPEFETAQRTLSADNSQHATYGMSLTEGIRDLIRRYRAWRALVNAQKEAARQGLPMPTSIEEPQQPHTQTVGIEPEKTDFLSEETMTVEPIQEAPITDGEDATENRSESTPTSEVVEETIEQADSSHTHEMTVEIEPQEIESQEIDSTIEEPLIVDAAQETTAPADEAVCEDIADSMPITTVVEETTENIKESDTIENENIEPEPQLADLTEQPVESTETPVQEEPQTIEHQPLVEASTPEADQPKVLVDSKKKMKSKKRQQKALKTMTHRQEQLFMKDHDHA